MTHDSDNGRLSFGGEDVKGHDVSESPPGPEPNTRGQSPRRDRGGEEPETASSVRESVTTDPADGSKRSVSSVASKHMFSNCVYFCPPQFNHLGV